MSEEKPKKVKNKKKPGKINEEKVKNNDTKKPKKKVKVFTKKQSTGSKEEQIIKNLKEKYESIDTTAINTFYDLPLSPKTLTALKNSGYKKPTDIQRETIKLSLQGKDILGAAQTGSGKTLAFLIPIVENLFCSQWTKLDGVGAIVITPTRELAYQIFETLRRVGGDHDFSAGLIIGGKDLKFERNRMDQCNIVICTPGRLLQHMDENPLFNCDNMQILVLDEADRCLDMGFADTMNAIIANLPLKRQTLLFSATQTKSVKDLARLSLKDPCYVSVHENKEHSTPSELQQSYVICKLEDKVSILWSFIKNHLKQKVIIFFSSCKQAKYMFEVFCKLRPGTSLLSLYGTLHQLRRMDIYESFCRKSNAVLFATDLAARGLDFPEVHWVVQADCPEDAATYIHRVGRTARFHRGGESLLMLLPSEEAMVDELVKSKIPINKIDINPDKLRNPVRKIEAYLAKDPSLKDTAQRCFKSYVKAVFLMKNKNVFKVNELDTDSYAHSLGLAIPPRIRFLQRLENKSNPKPATPAKNKTYFNSDDDDDDSPKVDAVKHDSEIEKPKGLFQVDDDDSDADDTFTVKRQNHDLDIPEGEEPLEIVGRKQKKPITKAALVKKMLHKNIVPNKKITFTDEGEAIVDATKEKRTDLALEYENEDEGGIDIEKAKIILKQEDKFDKQLFKEKVKAKHKEEKRKLKEQKNREKRGEDEEEVRDDFGTDSEDEAPDLSWLPDPDKIYGKKDSDDDDDDDDVYISRDYEKPKAAVKSKKRKLKSPPEETETTPSNKRKKEKLKDVCNSLSVNEAEELALMLLRNK